MNEGYQATLKSAETEDWVDFHIIRPFCYQCARVFAYFDVHPNTVTIWSMIIGAASAFFFAFGSFYYEGMQGLLMNIMAIIMLMVADVLDCTDGQLARMTGKKSRLGRILDGLAGFTWFFPIYFALVYRFYLHHDLEFEWLGIENTQQNTLIATAVVFVLAAISGLWGLQRQQRIADYYIQVHLFFLKGEKGSELDNSVKQREIYEQMTPETDSWIERTFQKDYIEYTRLQEKATPQFQRLMARLREKFGSTDNIPEEVRKEVHDCSLPMMKWNGLLTFNFRETWLFLFCLIDLPACHFLFESIVMTLMMWAIIHRHESFCKRIADKL